MTDKFSIYGSTVLLLAICFEGAVLFTIYALHITNPIWFTFIAVPILTAVVIFSVGRFIQQILKESKE